MGRKKDAKKAKAEEKARAKAVERAKRIAEDARAKKKGKGGKSAASAPLDGPAKEWVRDPRAALQVGPDFTLDAFVRDATPGWEGDEGEAVKALERRAEDFSELQERLYAASKAGARDAVLLIIQGLDPRARAGSSAMSSARLIPRGSRSPLSRRRPRRSARTTSCGGCGLGFPSRA